MLLERDHILDELDQLADMANAGSGKVVFVVGEAGIGKTSVLRALRDRIEGKLRQLSTAFEDIGSPEALTILLELPEISGDLLEDGTDGASRISVFREILSRLSAEPTALFIEDLHWADDSSIDFLRYIGRRVENLPLLLVISSRNEESAARSRIVRAAGDLAPEARTRFDLDRLSSGAVGVLAAASGQIGARVHEVTGGNPLLVMEVLASAGSRSQTIDELVTERAQHLSQHARSFLDFCSIIPRRVSADQIEAFGTEEDQVRECVDSGLLLQDGDGLAFRHELTRHAVEEALTPLKRRELHAVELDRLERSGGSAARRLHHAIGSGNRSSIAILAPQAAEQAAGLGAHRQAVRAWESLFEGDLAPQDPLVWEKYAFELHMIGSLDDAIGWQKRAIEHHRKSGNRLRLGDCLRFLSRLRYMNGERILADRAAEDAVKVLEGLGEGAELAHAYATRAQLAVLSDRNDEAIRWSELANTLAEKSARPDILATSFNNQATALIYRDPDGAIDLFERSIELGRKTGSHEHVARALINRTWLYLSLSRPEEALVSSQEGIEYCRDHELAAWEQYLRGGHAMARLDLGRWEEILADTQAALDHPAATSLVRNSSLRANTLLRIRRGLPGIEAQLDELREQGAGGVEKPRFVSYAVIQAEHAWTTREATDEAYATLATAYEYCGPDGRPGDSAAIWFWSRKLGKAFGARHALPPAYAHLAAGEVEEAARAMRSLQMPFEEALILAEGDEAQAMRGLAILDQLGATATADRVRAELVERGIRKGTRGPRQSTRRNSFGLTRREVGILNELALGLSNKEIAVKLFLSPKTVDHHVSSILSKTETKSRGEAAAFARRENLID